MTVRCWLIAAAAATRDCRARPRAQSWLLRFNAAAQRVQFRGVTADSVPDSAGHDDCHGRTSLTRRICRELLGEQLLLLLSARADPHRDSGQRRRRHVPLGPRRPGLERAGQRAGVRRPERQPRLSRYLTAVQSARRLRRVSPRRADGAGRPHARARPAGQRRDQRNRRTARDLALSRRRARGRRLRRLGLRAGHHSHGHESRRRSARRLPAGHPPDRRGYGREPSLAARST